MGKNTAYCVKDNRKKLEKSKVKVKIIRIVYYKVVKNLFTIV